VVLAFVRLVVLESGLGLESELSPFLLDLDLHSDLRRYVTMSTFIVTVDICSVLFRPFLPTRIVYATKDLRYLHVLNIYCSF